nr:hypothetical protein [Tanacetum cinerariifolium]
MKEKSINGEVQLENLVDGKKVIITESTIRRDLQLEDPEGVDCLPNDAIFEQLTLMGTMVSVITCLATNQKFNFSKYIFESMVKNLDNVNKFLMYPRKDFSGRETPLFPTMMVQAQEEIVNEEMDDSLERDTTTTTSLDVEQDRCNIFKTQSKATTNKPGSQGTSSVTTAVTTPTISIDEVTLAQALTELKLTKPKAKAQQEVEANIALIESYDDVQAKINADYLLAERLQVKEQQQLNDGETAKLFMQLLEKKRKFFVEKRAEEKGNKPPT